jgi:sec-independent protein translocase protein TatA
MVLLQFVGMPGGPELLVILFMALLLFGIPMVLVLVLGVAWLRSSGRVSEERVEQLEAEIETLRAELEGDGNSDSHGGPPDPDADE